MNFDFETKPAALLSLSVKRAAPCLLVAAMGLVSWSLPLSAADRPDVLMIVVDDLNDWIGCLGRRPSAITPHIDRLAARGTLFVNAHCQAPLCNPSRTSVLSGLRPSTTGVYGLQPGARQVPMLKNWVMLPQYFAQHGYFTASFGKVWHDGSIKPADQAAEFAVYGPAAGEPLPKTKIVTTESAMKVVDWVDPKGFGRGLLVFDSTTALIGIGLTAGRLVFYDQKRIERESG